MPALYLEGNRSTLASRLLRRTVALCAVIGGTVTLAAIGNAVAGTGGVLAGFGVSAVACSLVYRAVRPVRIIDTQAKAGERARAFGLGLVSLVVLLASLAATLAIILGVAFTGGAVALFTLAGCAAIGALAWQLATGRDLDGRADNSLLGQRWREYRARRAERRGDHVRAWRWRYPDEARAIDVIARLAHADGKARGEDLALTPRQMADARIRQALDKARG